MKDFNLKKYLANNPLLNEEEEEIDRFEKIEHVFSGEEEDLVPKKRHDGTSWKEFDAKRDDLMTQAEVGIDELLTSLHDQAYELGGDTNGPGIWYDIKDLLRDKL